MRKMGIALSLICTGLFLAPIGAHAQATRTWVSGVGDDVNPCSRTAPCKTFPGTIVKTAAGGEIDTLDPGSFASVTITKAITIASEGSGEAGILASGTFGVTINAGAGDVVVLRGLQINGAPVSVAPGLIGVRFLAGRTLMIQNCIISNFASAAPNGYGVSFTPVGGGSLQQLLIDDSVIENNGQSSGAGGGVFIQPTGIPNINVAINNTQVSNNNAFGIRADGTQSTGGTIAMSITNSESSGNGTAGIAVIAGSTAGSTAVLANVSRTVITNNNVGINGNGSFATFHLGGSTLTNNATGVKNTSATMNSFGGNLIADNPIPGPALPIIGPF